MYIILIFQILLIWICVSSKRVDIKQKINSYDSHKRFQRIHQLLNVYKNQHSIETLRGENATQLCSRKFIISQVFCRDAGNGIGLFLDNLAWAIILNRTIAILWYPKLCYESVEINPWITHVSELEQLLVMHNCPYTKPKRIQGTENQLACCNIQQQLYNETFINPGSTSKNAFNSLFATKGYLNKNFTNKMINRMQILFSNPMELASYESYGLLSKYAIKFTQKVINYNTHVINSIHELGTSNIIAVHIRHQKLNNTFESWLDNEFIKCIYFYKSLILNQTIDQKCIILLATDREETMKRIIALQSDNQFGCLVKFVLRDNFTRVDIHRPSGEHGIWGESLISMSDLYLLSHANYFLGTFISSYSTIIANSISAKSRKRIHSKEPYLWGLQIHERFPNQKSDDLRCFPYADRKFTSKVNSENENIYYDHNQERCLKRI